MGTTRETDDGTVAALGSDSETGEAATKGSYSETGGTETNGGTEGATTAGINAIFRVADVSDRFA